MTRNEKIRKLGNAVKDFRGRCISVPKPGEKPRWIRPPQETAIGRVAFWLDRLNLPVAETLHQIRSMKSWQEFNTWVGTL